MASAWLSQGSAGGRMVAQSGGTASAPIAETNQVPGLKAWGPRPGLQRSLTGQARYSEVKI